MFKSLPLGFLAFLCGYFWPTPTPRAVEFLSGEARNIRELVATVDDSGATWIAFLSTGDSANLKQADLCLRLQTADGGAKEIVFASGPAIGPLTMTALPQGGVYLVWEGRKAKLGRGLFAREVHLPDPSATPESWQMGEVEALDWIPAPALQPHLASLADGSLGLVWQALEGHYYRAFFAARSVTGQWAPPRAVTPLQQADIWRPRLAGSPKGQIFVAYDRFQPGSRNGFDVRLAVASSPSAPFSDIPVAVGPTYQGWPEIAVDSEGKAWICYEEAPSFGQGGPLRSRRRTRLVAVDAEGSVFHAQLPQQKEGGERGDFPKLFVSSTGLAISRRLPQNAYRPRNPAMRSFYATWLSSLLRFDQKGRATEEILATTDGGNTNDGVLLQTTQGLQFFFSTDARSSSFRQRFSFDDPLENTWRLAQESFPQLRGFPALEAGPSPSMKQTWSSVSAQGLAYEKRTPRALFGDLHRHTDLSRCAGRKDGVLLDAVRYARGPGALDFLALTDHFQHMTPWSFWRQQRDLERWDAPESLALLPGVERMVAKWGHQNLVFEDVETLGAAGLDHSPAQLARGSVIGIPHMTSLPRNPFDWRRLDPQIHRLIEVHQGRRGSFEGMPVGEEKTAPSQKDGWETTWPFAAFPAGNSLGWLTRLPLVMNSKAVAPGLISSSDHASSGAGFAGIVLAPGEKRRVTREAVFAALLQRHTFASSGAGPYKASIHWADVAIQHSADGKPTLAVFADRASLGSLTVFANGKVVQSLGEEKSTEDVRYYLVRSHFGKGKAWRLQLDLEGGRFAASNLRQPRPGLPSPESLAPTSIGYNFPAHLSYAADVDWVFAVTPDHGEPLVLHLKYTPAKEGEKVWDSRLSLADLHPVLAQRWWMEKTSQEPYLEVIALGGEVLGASSHEDSPCSNEVFQMPLEASSQGQIFYARVTWTDGNVAWTRLLRFTD